MLSHQNNDTIRKNIKDDGYIKYEYPYTIKEKEQFKDILDTGKVLLVPYVKNIRLSSIREYPILICDDYGQCTAYHINDSNIIRKYTKFETHDSFMNHIKHDTIKDYTYTENKTLKQCVFFYQKKIDYIERGSI